MIPERYQMESQFNAQVPTFTVFRTSGYNAFAVYWDHNQGRFPTFLIFILVLVLFVG